MCISIWPSTTPESVILLSPLMRLRYRTTLLVMSYVLVRFVCVELLKLYGDVMIVGCSQGGDSC